MFARFRNALKGVLTIVKERIGQLPTRFTLGMAAKKACCRSLQ